MRTRGIYRHPRSPFWFLDYTDSNGKRIRESSKTTDRAEAQRILDDKRGRVARGEVLLPRADKITFDEASADMLAHYQANQKRDLQELQGRLAHLTEYFAGKRLVAIKPDVVTRYVLARKEAGAAGGTIRNEIDLLIRALRIAVDNGKMERVRGSTVRQVSPARGGFVDDVQFASIQRTCPMPSRSSPPSPTRSAGARKKSST